LVRTPAVSSLSPRDQLAVQANQELLRRPAGAPDPLETPDGQESRSSGGWGVGPRNCFSLFDAGSRFGSVPYAQPVNRSANQMRPRGRACAVPDHCGAIRRIRASSRFRLKLAPGYARNRDHTICRYRRFGELNGQSTNAQKCNRDGWDCGSEALALSRTESLNTTASLRTYLAGDTFYRP